MQVLGPRQYVMEAWQNTIANFQLIILALLMLHQQNVGSNLSASPTKS